MSRLLVLLACSIPLMGCILRDFDYEPPENVPPSVHGSAETPLDYVYIVDLEAVPGGDGGANSNLEFVATVRDANVDDHLVGVVFLDRSEIEPGPDRAEVQIPPELDANARERRVPFDLDRGRITTPGCHRVELHVSRAFDNIFAPVPATEGDLGVGVWWIAAINAGTTSVDMTACRSRPL